VIGLTGMRSLFDMGLQLLRQHLLAQPEVRGPAAPGRLESRGRALLPVQPACLHAGARAASEHAANRQPICLLYAWP
jgi:hypothetical protein